MSNENSSPSSGGAGSAVDAKAEKTNQEKADKKRKSRVELAGAIIIGIAAVLTAIATYAGSQVDGTAQEKSAEAIGLTVEANDAYNDSNAFRAEERAWFFDYVTAEASDGQEFTADLLSRAMPLEVQQLTVEWFEKNEARLDSDEPIDDPFLPEGDFYNTFQFLPSVILLDVGNARFLQAQCALFESEVAGVQGDSYGLSTVFLAIALVVGGIAALLNGKAAQIIVLATATFSLVIGAGVLLFAGDEAEARLDTATEFFAFDENDKPAGSPAESLATADRLCPTAPATAAAADTTGSADARPTTAAATSVGTATTAAPATTTTTLPPNDLGPPEDGETVAVYLDIIEESATSGSLEDDFADAINAAESQGYGVHFRELACDGGASDWFGLVDDTYYAAAVYFSTLGDADAFAAAYTGSPVEIVEVRILC